MLRSDGLWTFYKIQYQCDGNKWHYANLDYFFVHDNPWYDEFKASGNCWQATGEHGTFNKQSGELAVLALVEKYQQPFRLVMVTIKQETKSVFSVSVS